MNQVKRRLNELLWVGIFVASAMSVQAGADYYDPHPFGKETTRQLAADYAAVGEWWNRETDTGEKRSFAREASGWFKSIDRSKVLAFALYTQDDGVLKITAQCFPLKPEEPKTVTLMFKEDGEWKEAQQEPVLYPGWSAHFRVESWDDTKEVPYRVCLGDLSRFEGVVRKNPKDKDTIVVGLLSCNSPKDTEFDTRNQIVRNLKLQDPDLLFFAGDQNYNHAEATFGWLLFGVQFAEIMKDRPTVCIPDDHDVGHGNLWGEGGKVAKGNGEGGYKYPPEFVNMVQRQQTWNLPDPFDPTPVLQDITVYYTDLDVGGISFAILEDRKFKSGPLGKVPKLGERVDLIHDPSYDRSAVDIPGLVLLGDRQLEFLDAWARDWNGAEMKVVLSQTAFCGAVHLHGNENNRMLADLDCNGWPQTPRNTALKAIRRAHASHLCGDQHLAVSVKLGIDGYRDGPYAFTGPAIVNTIYGRWWHPESEKPGGGEPIGGPNPWVGDYEDGLGNKLTMLAYANPKNKKERSIRGDGYGIVRYHKASGNTTFECWPRFADVSKGDSEQYAGWPITFHADDNDGRQPVGHLKKVDLPVEDAVVELTNDETGELIYCYRVRGKSFEAPVYAKAKHTLKAGKDRGDTVLLSGAVPE